VRDEVVPLDSDIAASARLGRAAILGRPWIGTRGPEIADQFEAALRAGDRQGALFLPNGTAVGIAVWQSHGPLGLNVNLLYLEPPHATLPMYARFWRGLGTFAPPIVFAPGETPELTEEEETNLMTGAGFARFGRSEMRLKDGVSTPPVVSPKQFHVRPVGPGDSSELARLHRIAYHDRFDRYLFLEDADEEVDAARMAKDLFAGRWGVFSPEGSWGIEEHGRLVAGVLSTQRGDGVLIADVMVDPTRQGEGLGRTVLVATLRGLAAAGIGPVFLNVTEGNDRAIRLYERLGFVRTLGPSRDWYDPRRIPARP
jgi:GNAT superfamily N-acetyltransferase